MIITDDPVADFERHEAERERKRRRIPRCSECDEHIQTDYAYYINGEWICPDCMEQYRKIVDADL